MVVLTGCSSKKNTAGLRWRQAFHTRYNVYFNGSQAFVEGSLEKENGNQDNFTELIPLYVVGNKDSRSLGQSNFETAIVKSEKAIKLHSIKKKPQWTKQRRKTAKDVEWLNRREYNPFLWKAWLLLGKSQFQMGNFDEAAATFSYMSRLYQTQPAINGISRAWLAKSYVELGWLYDAEDVITKMQRDSMHYRAVADWDYTYADYYIHAGKYEDAIPYLRRVIKHEKRRKLRARQWYLLGQLYGAVGNKQMAYKAYKKVCRLNPPYNLAFNSHIAQTEVVAENAPMKMIRRLRRMANNDNNKDFLDQVYYAMGNIYLSQSDTIQAIKSYEIGREKSMRNGVERGVLLIKLGDLYWNKENYVFAQRCYGEAIGLLDQDRKDYEEISRRSKILDELVPYISAVNLQDSLQLLAKMDSVERNAAIDRVIDELLKKEKEEKIARQIAESEMQSQQSAIQQQQFSSSATEGSVWYFYNSIAVNQGKTSFRLLWGNRENADDWQRANKTVVKFNFEDEDDELDEMEILNEGNNTTEFHIDKEDSLQNNPHNREYYLTQIPFTVEQLTASNAIIQDALFRSGVIFKDKLHNLRRSEMHLLRLTGQYPDYQKTDEVYYHLFLLYSRLGEHVHASTYIDSLKQRFPQSKYAILLSDPYFAENQKFGVHLEDSLYASTYNAFKQDRFNEVEANTKLSTDRFPLGENRPKFLLICGLSKLHYGDVNSCMDMLGEIVEKYPQSDVAEIAGMIIKGVREGRSIKGGRFDVGDVWARRTAIIENTDSMESDTLSVELNTNYVFMLAYQPDSVNSDQLLYELAKYNFTNFIVRNFDINLDADNGIQRMMFSGFLSYDEALQYARQLYSDPQMAKRLAGCRRIIISEHNLPLLGRKYSYQDYDAFFEQSLAPIEISDDLLLIIPPRENRNDYAPNERFSTEEEVVTDDEEEAIVEEEINQDIESFDGDQLLEDEVYEEDDFSFYFDDDFYR